MDKKNRRPDVEIVLYEKGKTFIEECLQFCRDCNTDPEDIAFSYFEDLKFGDDGKLRNLDIHIASPKIPTSMSEQSPGKSPHRKQWDRDSIMKALCSMPLDLAYKASILTFINEVLRDLVDDMDNSSERNKLAGIEALMLSLSEEFSNMGETIDLIHRAMEKGEDLIDKAA